MLLGCQRAGTVRTCPCLAVAVAVPVPVPAVLHHGKLETSRVGLDPCAACRTANVTVQSPVYACNECDLARLLR